MGKETTKKVQDTDGQLSTEIQSQPVGETLHLDPSLADAFVAGVIDEIITPVQIRGRLAQHLEFLYHKMNNLGSARHSIV